MSGTGLEPGGTARPPREAACPREASVDALFEAQAARTPGAVAVAAEQARLTCRELDERASRLARRLAAAGVGGPRRRQGA